MAGTAVAGVALATGCVVVDLDAVEQFFRDPLSMEGEVPRLIGLFSSACLMSLFPDLDSSSVPQRWFYRVVFFGLTILFYKQQMDWFTVLAFIAILPVVHRHRGWTHHKITPFLVSIFLAIVLEYYHHKTGRFGNLSVDSLVGFFRIYWIFVFACVFGHYAHLFLDSRFASFFSFFFGRIK